MIKLKDILNEIEGYDPLLEKMGLVKHFEIGLKVAFPQLAQLNLFLRSDGDELHLNSIRVKPKYRGQGIGGRVMKKILEFADQNQLVVTLQPVPEKGYEDKLGQFYKKFGFIQAHPNWLRYPKK